MSHDSDIGLNIKRRRKAKGFTQEELASASGLTVKSLSQIENGHTFPRRNNLNAIARVLECQVRDLSVGSLVSREDLRGLKKEDLLKSLSLVGAFLSSLSKNELSLIFYFRRLSPEAQKGVFKTLKTYGRGKKPLS